MKCLFLLTLGFSVFSAKANDFSEYTARITYEKITSMQVSVGASGASKVSIFGVLSPFSYISGQGGDGTMIDLSNSRVTVTVPSSCQQMVIAAMNSGLEFSAVGPIGKDSAINIDQKIFHSLEIAGKDFHKVGCYLKTVKSVVRD